MHLESERLIYREFVADDWQFVYDTSHDPAQERYGDGQPLTPAEARSIVDGIYLEQRQLPRRTYNLMLEAKHNHSPIGAIYVTMRDPIARKAELGYRVATRYWGQGYATEAVHCLTAYAFNRLQVHRLYGEVVAENVASRRVLEKCGFQVEATLRDNLYFGNRWWDTLICAILVDDYTRWLE